MNSRLLKVILNGVAARWYFMFKNMLTLVFSIYYIKYIVFKLIENNNMGQHGLDEINLTLEALGGVLVGLGVLMECRHIILRSMGKEFTPLQLYLNEISEHCGVGVLIIGLTIEVLTVVMIVPTEVINMTGWEIYIYSANILLVVCACIINFIFIKECGKTFFREPPEVRVHHH